MAVYSYSRLTIFEQCGLKYKFRYIDKIQPPIEATIEAFLGKCMHAALEYLYQQKMKDILVELDDVLAYYLRKWHREFSEKLLIVDRYLKAEDYLNKGIKFLTKYYLKHYPFPEQTLATEKKIFLDLKDECKLIGFIDRLAWNEQEQRYEIHDYKTGALKTQEQADADRQLALYALALREELRDGKDIVLIWHYLGYDQHLISQRNEIQFSQLKQEILELINEIEKTKVFYPRKSKLCHWCEFKPICPAWTKQTTLGVFET